MRTLLSLFTVLLMCLGMGDNLAQESGKVFKVVVKTIDNQRERGVLVEANKEAIVINTSNDLDFDATKTIPVSNISMLKISRRGAVLKGAGIGALMGAATGAAIGFGSGDPKENCSTNTYPGWGTFTTCYEGRKASEKALDNATAMGIFGAGVGAIMGTGKKKFRINGDPEMYLQYLSKLRYYSYSHER